jgi:hypothetical protein
MGQICPFRLHVLRVRSIRLPLKNVTLNSVQIRLATNIIVSSMLILGGSATVTDLTGMSTIAVGILGFRAFASIYSTRLFSGVFPHSRWCRILRRSRWHAVYPAL